MHFDVPSSVRKTKASQDVEMDPAAKKRQKVLSPLKFSNIQKVSKKSLQQQRVPSPGVSPTKTAVSPVQSSPVMTLNGSPSGVKESGRRLGHINVIFIAVKKKLVGEFEE